MKGKVKELVENDDLTVESLGTHLNGKKIAMIVPGGIAAYKAAPSIARHCRQYGADVVIYTTSAALEFTTETSMDWASQNEVIMELTGSSEHLLDYDAYVVVPATLDFIGDMANGIAHDAATTTAASAFGKIQHDDSKKLIVVPAMHGSMYANPAFQRNIEFLKEKNVKFVEPKITEDKANLADTHSIVAYTIRELSEDPLKGKMVLLNAGPCWAKIDDVRAVTNIFRGRLGIAIAEELYMRGADVRLIYGPGGLQVPKFIDTVKVKYYEDMYDAVLSEVGSQSYDVGIFSSAIPDYKPREVVCGKIKSTGGLEVLEFDHTEKIINKVRDLCPELCMATFKLEVDIEEADLLEIGWERLKDYDVVVANLLEDMSERDHTVHPAFVMKKDGTVGR